MKLEDLTEKEFDAQLFNSQKGLATMLGWRLRYHVLRSKGSQPGFPDRVLVRDRIVYAETKTEKGKPSAHQVEWLDGLAAAGGEVYLWRPSDLDEIGRVLARRGGFLGATSERPAHFASLDGWWQPNSLWLAGHGRLDAA